MKKLTEGDSILIELVANGYIIRFKKQHQENEETLVKLNVEDCYFPNSKENRRVGKLVG